MARTIASIVFIIASIMVSRLSFANQEDTRVEDQDLIHALMSKNSVAAKSALQRGALASGTYNSIGPSGRGLALWKADQTNTTSVNRPIVFMLVGFVDDKHYGQLPRDTPELMEIMLNHGADPNAKDEYGVSPLQLASGYSLFGSVRVLLEHGANPNHTDNDGDSPLVTIAYVRPVDATAIRMAKLLLQHKANVNIHTRQGGTALIYAIRNNASEFDLPFVQLLLRHGAKVSYKDKFGKTALDYAKERKPLLVPLLSTALARERVNP